MAIAACKYVRRQRPRAVRMQGSVTGLRMLIRKDKTG